MAKFQTDESNAAAEISRVDVRLARQNNQTVVAPRAGTILRRRTGEAAELVKAGDAIATLVPETESRSVELWVDGNDLPLVQGGREVRLQFEGWPAVQFSGWPSVAVGTFPGRVTLVDITDDGTGRFRVVIEPLKNPKPEERWPSGQMLRLGVRAKGWILLDRVTVGYELWRRFNGFPQSLSGKPKTSEGAGDQKS